MAKLISEINGNKIYAEAAVKDSAGNSIQDTYATKTEMSSKQDVISDLDTIRSDAALGATALQSETDPVFTASPAHDITSTDISNWNAKQDKLTAGTNITIEDNVISASGGGQDVFIAEVNNNDPSSSTSYAQVLAAYNSGKTLLMRYFKGSGKQGYVLPLAWANTAETASTDFCHFVFSGFYGVSSESSKIGDSVRVTWGLRDNSSNPWHLLIEERLATGSEIGNKQDKLTAGSGISLSGSTISTDLTSSDQSIEATGGDLKFTNKCYSTYRETYMSIGYDDPYTMKTMFTDQYMQDGDVISIYPTGSEHTFYGAAVYDSTGSQVAYLSSMQLTDQSVDVWTCTSAGNYTLRNYNAGGTETVYLSHVIASGSDAVYTKNEDITVVDDKVTAINGYSVGGGSEYSAGTGISISDNVISADTTVLATVSALSGKQDTISDLDTIRSGAALGATALQSYTETDPVFSASPAASITNNDKLNWSEKQHALTPGAGISISSNVISIDLESRDGSIGITDGHDLEFTNKTTAHTAKSTYDVTGVGTVFTDLTLTKGDIIAFTLTPYTGYTYFYGQGVLTVDGTESTVTVRSPDTYGVVHTCTADSEVCSLSINNMTGLSSTVPMTVTVSAETIVENVYTKNSDITVVDDKVTAINGHALAGGGSSYTAGTGITISDNVISADTTVLEPAFSVGDGLEMTVAEDGTRTLHVENPVDIVAGPGIVIDNPDGNSLRISCEADAETVLWEGTPTSSSDTLTMSEAWSNFDKIEIHAQSFERHFIVQVESGSLLQIGGVFCMSSHLQAWGLDYRTSDNLNYTWNATCNGYVGSTLTYTWNSSIIPVKIVGIHRKSST